MLLYWYIFMQLIGASEADAELMVRQCLSDDTGLQWVHPKTKLDSRTEISSACFAIPHFLHAQIVCLCWTRRSTN